MNTKDIKQLVISVSLLICVVLFLIGCWGEDPQEVTDTQDTTGLFDPIVSSGPIVKPARMNLSFLLSDIKVTSGPVLLPDRYSISITLLEE